MKDTMIDIMISMMPIMKPFMWVGVGFTVLGLLFLSGKIAFKRNTNVGILWTERLVLTVAVFFILAQIAGYFLGMPPKINFGDTSKLEFILVHFWQIGLAFFAVAMIFRFSRNQKRIQPFKNNLETN